MTERRGQWAWHPERRTELLKLRAARGEKLRVLKAAARKGVGETEILREALEIGLGIIEAAETEARGGGQ